MVYIKVKFISNCEGAEQLRVYKNSTDMTNGCVCTVFCVIDNNESSDQFFFGDTGGSMQL